MGVIDQTGGMVPPSVGKNAWELLRDALSSRRGAAALWNYGSSGIVLVY